MQNPAQFDEFKALIDAALANAPTPPADNSMSTEAVHEHADFMVYINNKKLDFSPDKYQSDEGGEAKEHDHATHQHDAHVHLHGKGGRLIHKHKKGITLGYFFKTIGLEFIKQCFVTDDKTRYCTDEKNSLKLFVNGKRREENDSYEFNDLDRILITYGPLTDSNLQAQLKSVTNEACIYSETCPERGQAPEEKCVGGLGSDCRQ